MILNHYLCELHKRGWVFLFCVSLYSFTIHIFLTLKAGAHNPEGATSMRSFHDVFKDQFIFRTVLARVLNIFKIFFSSLFK